MISRILAIRPAPPGPMRLRPVPRDLVPAGWRGVWAWARPAARDPGAIVLDIALEREPCPHPGALGPCMPRVADGCCIWCGRDLPPVGGVC